MESDEDDEEEEKDDEDMRSLKFVFTKEPFFSLRNGLPSTHTMEAEGGREERREEGREGEGDGEGEGEGDGERDEERDAISINIIFLK